MNEAEFQQTLRDHGFGEGQIKTYPPNANGPMHTHDFNVMLLVLEGPFSLATDEGVTSFQAGQVCELAAGARHVEQTGPEGARVLLGKG
jgi:quercetin dioxygenase-like cupin family protein